MDFWFKTNDNEEIIIFLNKCNRLGLLGDEILYGSYLSDSEKVNEVMMEKNPIDYYDLSGIAVCIDNREHIKKNFKHLLGKNNTMVGLVTKKDVKENDVPNKKYKNLNKALQALNYI